MIDLKINMRSDTIILIPAILMALCQITIWRKLPDNNQPLIRGKYTISHFIGFIFAKYSTYTVFIYQISFNIFKITNRHIYFLYSLGYILIIIGFIVSISAIKELKGNWSNMMFYKIISNHKLIKTGVYKYIRHPIYSAIILEVVGYEIISNSWLFLFFLVASTTILCLHIENEEGLLLKYFGDEYINYKMETKKIIPFVY